MIVQINIKVSEALKDEIQKAAKRQGLGMSGFIRMVCWEWIRRDRAASRKTKSSRIP
jgi:antitoxin component of RelBE/YafQ-DinJ toxin-antitoxin module